MEESLPATHSDIYSAVTFTHHLATVDKYRDEAGSLPSLQSFRVADQG